MKINSTPSTALIISTYNWPQALKLVLECVWSQTVLPAEVLIADDGSAQETKELIDLIRADFPVPVRHFWHEDNGFRKSIIVNRAIASSTCDYIIQIDGDIMIEKHFVEDHINSAEKGFYMLASRVLLDEKLTSHLTNTGKADLPGFFSGRIVNRINTLRIPFLKNLFTKKESRSDNFRACNCAFWKSDFVAINGYNNDITGWGHEDIELAARFVNNGVSQKKIKMVALCYHLHHAYFDQTKERSNFKLYEQTVNEHIKICRHGITQL